ncbi:MAG: GNAT family N-acetyltransferase [Roseburia sp.]|nr:GNAT family N-acetyltransferase [Roseburia sp.]
MELKTDRLYIRNMRATDWLEVQKIFIDFNHSEYVYYDSPLPVEDKEAEKLTKIFADSNLFFAVFEAGAAEMVGYVCFHDDNGKYDVGYCFHSAYHGKGYAFESVNALMKYFREEIGVKTFTAGTAIENVPSCKLLKKLGFACVSVEPRTFHKDDAGNDILFQGGNFVCE